ncbi:MAG: FtsW/RodA/SpoVE family cell cycle protein [Clostridia bacterium]|nr:FtsW/RodA/SpoVE family cell cycle protein [Clostridia bacterium]
MTGMDLDTMKKAASRSSGRTLTGLLVLFQATAMLLLTFKIEYTLNLQSLILAAAMPAVSLLLLKGLPKVWNIDRVMLTMVLFLCSVSIVTLTATMKTSSAPLTQVIYIGVGLVAMIIGIAFIRKLKYWKRWIVPLMLFSLVFIALPLVIGDWKNGAKNWIGIERNGETLISIQPSEFVKVTLMFVLAGFLSERQSRAKTFAAVVFGALLCVILLLERDLGALVLYFLTTIILYFLATSNLLITAAGLCAGCMGAVCAYFMFDYVKTRLAIWQNPWLDPEVSGYQIIQALVAIGSGGASGMGLGLGLARDIPLYYSDFIYAAICEEFGFVFALLLLAVYVIIIMRGISIAMSARTSFHALLSFGIVAILGLQTLLIVGGNIRLIPLTGVVLPFIASGGSSMVSYLGATGLLLGISSLNADADQEDIERAEWRDGRLV